MTPAALGACLALAGCNGDIRRELHVVTAPGPFGYSVAVNLTNIGASDIEIRNVVINEQEDCSIVPKRDPMKMEWLPQTLRVGGRCIRLAIPTCLPIVRVRIETNKGSGVFTFEPSAN